MIELDVVLSTIHFALVTPVVIVGNILVIGDTSV
jgi:hypothetical protein